MASKRKAAPNSSTNRRKSKKKENDFEDSLSDEGSDHGNGKDVEVLIPGDADTEPEKLPEDLLKTLEKPGGQMLIAGMVTWDAVGKKDTRKVAKMRPNLFSFHRYTDETVTIYFLVLRTLPNFSNYLFVCSIALLFRIHLLLIR